MIDVIPDSIEKKVEPTIEEKVRDAIELIDSDHESREEWSLLNRLQGALKKLEPKTERIVNLIETIAPVLAKYGMHGVEDGDS